MNAKLSRLYLDTSWEGIGGTASTALALVAGYRF